MAIAATGLCLASPAAASAAAPAAQPPAGTVLAWGYIYNGLNPSDPASISPTPGAVGLPAGTRVTAVAGGGYDSMVLTSAGSVLAWGQNTYGQLGDGTTTDSPTPVPVHLPAGTRVTAISISSGDGLALTSAGSVLAWGDNRFGQLGDGTTTGSSTPVPVHLPAGTRVTAVAAGNGGLLVTSSGSLLVLGMNSLTPTPVHLPAGVRVTAVAANGDDSLALTSTGSVLAWGENNVGQLGDGTTANNWTPAPVDLPAGTRVTAISLGVDQGLAVTSAGSVLAWGGNKAGDLGNGNTTSSLTPVPVDLPAGVRVTSVAASSYVGLALTSNRGVLAWGDNYGGQLGDGSIGGFSSTPVAVDLPAGVRVTAIAADLALAAPDHEPPVLGDIESSALRFAAGAPPVRVTPSLTVTSTATTTLTGATASVTSGLVAGQDVLAFTGQNGITGSYSPSTGVLTFTGTATVSAYANELRSVTYTDTNAATPYGTRTISFQVSDGEPDNSLSNVVSRTVLVTAKPPAAAGDKATTGKNAPVTISVLANDTDPARLPLTIASVNTTGTKGTATINPGQTTITYNPNGQFAGLAAGKTATDKFTYKATDGHQTSSAATVTVTITGSGTAPQPPAVISHSYTAVGNTPLGVGTHPAAPAATVSGTVLSGDSDADPTATLSVTATTAPAHGTVTVNPDGTFTYLPNPGYSGTDTFQATVAGSNAPAVTATETVTITVGTVVWYVNNSGSAAGNGTAASPFSTLAAADAAAGPNSILFLYGGDALYGGVVSMQPGEDLWGQPHGLTVGGYSLVPAGGAAPEIAGGRVGIDLAEGADVEGVSLPALPSEYGGGPSGSGIEAVNVNDATVGATSPVVLGGGISVSGGDGNLNFADSGVEGQGAVTVSGRSGGTVTFGGPISTSVVQLSDNAGATIAFTGTLTLVGYVYSGLNVGGAFIAVGGGTVTATGSGSTINSPDALTVQNTTIGAAGLTFQRVSSGGSAFGIDLDNTGSSGGLTVTGNGTPGSGGTIEYTTGPGPGIQLTSTYEPSFTDMIINEEINGSQVDGLTLADCTVSANSGLDFPLNGGADGLTGAVSITNSTITSYSSAAADNAIISDTSGTLGLTVTGTTFSSKNPTTGSDGLDINADGSTNATVSVTGSTFTDNYGGAFQFATGPASAGPDSVTFTGNTVNGGGVDITADGNGTTCAAITGNSITGPALADIELDQDDATTVELPGYTGGTGDTSAVESFLTGGNNLSGTPTAVATVSGSGGGFTGAPGC